MDRIRVILSLVIVLLSVCPAAQPGPAGPGLEIKGTVDEIDSHLKRLNKSRVMLQTGTDRGGELTIFRRDSDVVRIDATIGGSNSDVQDVFYYFGAKVVFIRTKTVTYPYSRLVNGSDFSNPHVTATANYYVRDGKLIPVGHKKIAPPLASRLSQEAELFMAAVRRGDPVVDVEKILK